MGGKSGGGEQTTSSSPWTGQQSFLRTAYKQANEVYNQGKKEDYNLPFSTVAPISSQTAAGRDALSAVGQGTDPSGSVENQVASGYGDVLSGKYLDSGNPYFAAATAPITQNFQNTVLPQINSTFALGGRYGSPGAHAQAVGDATQSYQNTLGNMAYSNYATERGNMMNALPQATQTLQNASMQRAQAQLGAGSINDAYQQALLNEQANRYYTQEAGPWENLSKYSSIIQGYGYPGGYTQSTGSSPGGSPVAGALGGAMAGAAAGAPFGGWGAIPGAIIGGAAGYFGSR